MLGFFILVTFFGIMVICMSIGERINQKDYGMLPLDISLVTGLFLFMFVLITDIQNLNKIGMNKKV